MVTTVHRDFDGIRFEGKHYAVLMHPVSGWQHDGDPRVSVRVMALPALSGWDGPTTLGSDGTSGNFAPTDIELVFTDFLHQEMRCLRAPLETAAAFREGFVFSLEIGMHSFLQTELPRIDRVSRLAAAIRRAVVKDTRREPMPHEDAAIKAVAALVILDDRSPAGALNDARDHVSHLFNAKRGDRRELAELGGSLRASLARTVTGFLRKDPATAVPLKRSDSRARRKGT